MDLAGTPESLNAPNHIIRLPGHSVCVKLVILQHLVDEFGLYALHSRFVGQHLRRDTAVECIDDFASLIRARPRRSLGKLDSAVLVCKGDGDTGGHRREH